MHPYGYLCIFFYVKKGNCIWINSYYQILLEFIQKSKTSIRTLTFTLSKTFHWYNVAQTGSTHEEEFKERCWIKKLLFWRHTPPTLHKSSCWATPTTQKRLNLPGIVVLFIFKIIWKLYLFFTDLGAVR